MTVHHDYHKARLEIARLREALKRAREDMESWGEYASDFIREKWDLEGDLAAIDAALTPPASSPRPAPAPGALLAGRQEPGAAGADSPARDHA